MLSGISRVQTLQVKVHKCWMTPSICLSYKASNRVTIDQLYMQERQNMRH